MVASLERITYIIIFIPCMWRVLCVDGLEGKNLRASWFIIFSLLLFCTTAFQRCCTAKYWLGFCWNHTNMHSYNPWLKNYSYVIAITHSLLSRHCSVSYLYQCKCIILYVQFFWDSIMKWRDFINNKNNNNKKITVTFYVYVLLLKAVLKKTEVSGQKTLYYWMIIMDLPELYPEC